MRTLALIPARAGSKGIVDKNTRPFHGKPLLSWAVDVGNATCKWTYVTTESGRIAQVGLDAGAAFIMRPKSLAQDGTPMLPVVKNALEAVAHRKPEVIVLLQPTQPLRTAEHVRFALDLLKEKKADSVVSVVEVPAHYRPGYVVMHGVGGLRMWASGQGLDDGPTRRQQTGPAYSRDGTVYAIRREVIESGQLYGEYCLPLVIPPSQTCNIDTEEDWRKAEWMKRDAEEQRRHSEKREAGIQASV